MQVLKSYKSLLPLTLLLIGQCAGVYAQKLPKIQTASIKAPTSIKIDGKATEWNGQFQAHNSGQHVFYTVSNDSENLYLTLFTDDNMGSQKIFRGGITFSILPASGKAKLSVTYPAIKTRMEGPNILEVNVLKTDKILYGDTTNKVRVDSLLAVSNSLLKSTYKTIHVIGIPEITDPYIPVYNAQNITVGASFDKRIRYTYELGIPLKYVQVAAGTGKFKYNIKLNSEPLTLPPPPPSGGRIMIMEPLKPAGNVGGSGPNLDDEFMFKTTEFSGEYTLAK
ncbi:MAG: hypothetical protein EOP47_10775 [Sphingobacteriaceae bacterium]|nr:MAG: hypothetical protein EOP47_10775 [Sphingobacteriaceae bacterium]